MLIKAEQKYIRTSPRKLRLIAQVMAKMSPTEALEQLKFLNKRAAKPLLKVVKQAVANATNNNKLKLENLKFKQIEILAGSIQKRWRAVSRGRAHEIFKRTSHIKVILEDKSSNTKIRNPKQRQNTNDKNSKQKNEV